MSEGATFGPYRVVRKLGKGGMGVVYLGEHMLIGRRAAIKVLHRERSAHRDNVDRFFNEARATSAVEDPGIVQIYDFGVTPQGTAYLVMEYLDGEPLSTRLRKRGPLPIHDAVRITRQIASSLAAAHAVGIVHRDLKPENLFMVRDGEATGGERPKILDFGIAKLGDENENLDEEHFQTRTGAVMGTPAYMSPEQCNAGKVDQRTDIYSLGCVLFHLLTGRPPFDLDGVGTIIAAHLKETAPAPSTIASHVPASLDLIVARCLEKKPEDRVATMLELQQACDAVLMTLPVQTRPPTVPDAAYATSAALREDAVTTLGTSVGESSLNASPYAPPPMRRGVWLAVAAAAVIAGVVLAVMTTRRAPSEPDPAPPPAAASAPTFTPLPPPHPTITSLPDPEAKPAPVPPPPIDVGSTKPTPTKTTPPKKKTKTTPSPTPAPDDLYDEDRN